MTTKNRSAIFIVVLALAATSGTIAVASVSAQNSTDRQSNGTSSGTATTSGSTASGTKVSIPEGASTMDDQAFDPNPVNVKGGDNVIWTNDDSQPHTVTSGTGPSDPNMGKEFDSSPGFKVLLSPFQTFSHKFDTAGEFAYFCQIHPTMVGKVIVS